VYMTEVPKLWSAPPPRGGHCWYKGHIYLKYEHNIKYIYFGRHFAWLKYFTYQLVPIQAPNYKQHILLLAKVSFFSLSQHAD
jgi:hypothetical protein